MIQALRVLGQDLPFLKMEGCGNDYVYVDLAALPSALAARVRQQAPALARAVSDRHFGIGSDGLILIDAASGADATMVMYNADGSRGAMCGNGLRCIAKHLGDTRLADRDLLVIATDGGPRRARLMREAGEVARVEVDMGRPIFDAERIPLRPHLAEVVRAGGSGPWHLRVEVAGATRDAWALSMGNPHLTVLVPDDPATLDLTRVGPFLENQAFLPDRANVEFVQATAEGLRQRTWERGSGETIACGSGACAAVVAAVAAGLAARGAAVRVALRGGCLDITWTEAGEVAMAGPARLVFRGIYPA
jgi:diaminopimelate epimerase